MKDRIPKYPNRIKLMPVQDQNNTFDLVMADEPTEEGTLLSKATLLSDDTANLLWGTNVPNNPTVSDAFTQTFLSSFKVGYIIASMSEMDNTWKQCNGESIDSGEYPELAAILQSGMGNAGNWLSNSISVVPKRIKFVNGYWVVLALTNQKIVLYYSTNLSDAFAQWKTINIPSAYNIQDVFDIFFLGAKYVICAKSPIIGTGTDGKIYVFTINSEKIDGPWSTQNVSQYSIYAQSTNTQSYSYSAVFNGASLTNGYIFMPGVTTMSGWSRPYSTSSDIKYTGYESGILIAISSADVSKYKNFGGFLEQNTSQSFYQVAYYAYPSSIAYDGKFYVIVCQTQDQYNNGNTYNTKVSYTDNLESNTWKFYNISGLTGLTTQNWLTVSDGTNFVSVSNSVCVYTSNLQSNIWQTTNYGTNIKFWDLQKSDNYLVAVVFDSSKNTLQLWYTPNIVEGWQTEDIATSIQVSSVTLYSNLQYIAVVCQSGNNYFIYYKDVSTNPILPNIPSVSGASYYIKAKLG